MLSGAGALHNSLRGPSLQDTASLGVEPSQQPVVQQKLQQVLLLLQHLQNVHEALERSFSFVLRPQGPVANSKEETANPSCNLEMALCEIEKGLTTQLNFVHDLQRRCCV